MPDRFRGESNVLIVWGLRSQLSDGLLKSFVPCVRFKIRGGPRTPSSSWQFTFPHRCVPVADTPGHASCFGLVSGNQVAQPLQMTLTLGFPCLPCVWFNENTELRLPSPVTTQKGSMQLKACFHPQSFPRVNICSRIA